MMTHECPRRGENGLGLRPHKGDTWRDDNTCSYCGSLNPDVLMAAIEQGGVILGPTDKNYKVYVDTPVRKHAKFYFQHFTQHHRTRFIELLNSGTVTLDFPGHFYVLPFFLRRLEPGER